MNFLSSMVHWTRVVFRMLSMAAVMSCALLEYAVRRLDSAPAKAHWLHKWSVLALKALGIDFRMEGVAPKNGLLISNHQSYVDIIALSAAAPVVFVSKKEVGDWPAFGLFAKLSGTLFVDRSRRTDVARMVKEMDELREAGILMALFPEGTTGDGTALLPFKTSLLEPFCAAKSPVWSSALIYWIPSENSGRAVAWVGDDPLAGHLLQLLGKPRIECVLRFSPESTIHEDRKELAVILRQQVNDLIQGASGKVTATT